MRKAMIALLISIVFGAACTSSPAGTPKTVATGTPTPGPTPTPPAVQATGWSGVTVRSLCLRVEQSYPQIEGEFSLPIAETVQCILGRVGLQVVAEGTAGGITCDANLNITVSGKALGFLYESTESGAKNSRYCYTGATIEGHMTLIAPGREPLSVPVSGVIPTSRGVFTYMCSNQPSSAPFDDASLRALLDGMFKLWGLQSLVQTLGSEDSQVRMAVTEAIGKLGPDAREAIPALVKALEDDPDEDVRSKACEALRNIGPQAVPALSQVLMYDEDAKAREDAAGALGEIGPEAREAVPALIRALADKEEIVRQVASVALGRIGPGARDAVPALTKALRDGDKYVRQAAASALTKITGQDFGEDAARWQQWWEKNK